MIQIVFQWRNHIPTSWRCIHFACVKGNTAKKPKIQKMKKKWRSPKTFFGINSMFPVHKPSKIQLFSIFLTFGSDSPFGLDTWVFPVPGSFDRIFRKPLETRNRILFSLFWTTLLSIRCPFLIYFVRVWLMFIDCKQMKKKKDVLVWWFTNRAEA